MGGILVALMVLVSTKIKKSAAAAFESEIIDSEGFKLIKPDGFLHPLRDESDFAFEAYSKDFGEKSQRNVWKGQIYLTINEGLNSDKILKDIKAENGTIVSEIMSGNAEKSEEICLIERECSTEDATFSEFRKIVESRRQQKTYDLKMQVINSFRDDFIGRVDLLMNSFQLK